jgi:hypothetical protein
MQVSDVLNALGVVWSEVEGDGDFFSLFGMEFCWMVESPDGLFWNRRTSVVLRAGDWFGPVVGSEVLD